MISVISVPIVYIPTSAHPSAARARLPKPSSHLTLQIVWHKDAMSRAAAPSLNEHAPLRCLLAGEMFGWLAGVLCNKGANPIQQSTVVQAKQSDAAPQQPTSPPASAAMLMLAAALALPPARRHAPVARGPCRRRLPLHRGRRRLARPLCW